jgi:hypothetical protein
MGGSAVCTILTNSDDTQERIDKGLPGRGDRRGKQTRIKLGRFRPTSTGYLLSRDAPGREDACY